MRFTRRLMSAMLAVTLVAQSGFGVMVNKAEGEDASSTVTESENAAEGETETEDTAAGSTDTTESNTDAGNSNIVTGEELVVRKVSISRKDENSEFTVSFTVENTTDTDVNGFIYEFVTDYNNGYNAVGKLDETILAHSTKEFTFNQKKDDLFGDNQNSKVINVEVSEAYIHQVKYTSNFDDLSFKSAEFKGQQYSDSTFFYTLNNTISSTASKFYYTITLATPDGHENISGTADIKDVTSDNPINMGKNASYGFSQAIEYKIVALVSTECDWMNVNNVKVDGTKISCGLVNQSKNKRLESVTAEITYVKGDKTVTRTFSVSGNIGPYGVYTCEADMGEEGYSITNVRLSNFHYNATPLDVNITDKNSQKVEWLSAAESKLYRDSNDKLCLDLVINNKSGKKYAIRSFKYSVGYNLGTESKTSNGNVTSEAGKAYENYSTKIELQELQGEEVFEFNSLTISEVEYVEDSLNVEQQLIQNPSIISSTYGMTKVVAWSRVKFGQYYMTYDADGKAGIKGDIYWRVLQDKGDTLLLMADKALVSVPYEDSMRATTWADSALRSYLNEVFYKDAFSEAEQKMIVPSTLDNSGAGPQSVGGAATTDNVYVLSIADMNNQTYGLYGAASSVSTVPTRQIEATDYLIGINPKLKYNASTKYCNYYLRTPGYYQYDISGVSQYGVMNPSGWRTYTKTAAAVPVIQVRKSAVSYVDTVTRELAEGYETASSQALDYKKTKALSLDTVKVGDTDTVKGITYKVTKVSNKRKTVSVQSVRKNVKKVTIPKSVTIDGTKYKVTAIKANAFSNAKKTLKKITIKSTSITSINKKAFKGLKKGTLVKVTSTKYKKYKKMIKAKNVKVKSL